MNKLALGAAIAALSLAVPATVHAQKNRGASTQAVLVVDTDRVFSECTACRAASTQLQTQGQALQQRQQQVRQQLQTEGQPIQTAITALNGRQPDPALQSRITAFQNRQQQLSQELQGRSATLESTQAHVAKQVGDRLIAIVEQVRASHGALIAVAKGSTLANDTGVEVTNEVLTALNQQLPSVSVTPMPQQPQPPQPQGR